MEIYHTFINKMYDAFNSRDITTALSYMHKDVHWPNGWEGGYVDRHDEVRNYWIRQWKEIQPFVTPVSLTEKGSGQIEVEVHQIVEDLQGKVLFDGIVKHVYTFTDGLIKNMEIEK